MKKKSILLLCALTTFGAFAQKSLVDDVEHQIGGFNVSVDAYKEAAGKIKPALENAETKDQAKTWFVAGKANMGIYDQCMAMLQLGKDADKELMATSLMTAFNDFRRLFLWTLLSRQTRMAHLNWTRRRVFQKSKLNILRI